MKVKLSNCNCIKKAEIEIVEKQLNIKYGPNGTGKSTIGKAIYNHIMNNTEELNKLKPYNSLEFENPNVDMDFLSSVCFFNEEYINSYLFSDAKSLLNNSFQVFLKDIKSDELLQNINISFENLNKVFLKNETLEKIDTFLHRLFNTLKLENNKLIKRGGVNELISGYGTGFEKYSILDKYKPFYENRKFDLISDWAKWRNDGIKKMLTDKFLCPFCSDKLNDEEISNENKTFEKVFKKSALATANEIKEILNIAVEESYVSKDSSDKIIKNMGDSAKKDELNVQLEKFTIESDYLLNKLLTIKEFRPFNVTKDEIKRLENYLHKLVINKEIINDFYNTSFISNFIDEVNSKITDLENKTAELKKLFGTYESHINSLINERKADINDFFEIAGFPYKFEIKIDEAQKAHSLLIPIKSDTPINEIASHLSWGERNAFALVMFMFEAISINPDLIILDDPITSFDKNKKFAIMRRLFDERYPSFSGRTVLLVTHDLQPVIDFVHNNMFKNFGLQTIANAYYLANIDNELTEQIISSNDLKNTVELTKRIAADENEVLPVRIVNLRKFYELTDENIYLSEKYNILSSLIHGRPIPTKQENDINDNFISLTESEISKGSIDISEYISNFNYSSSISELEISKLHEIIKNNSNEYDKIICIRIILEQTNEKNINLFKQFRKEYPLSFKFLNETNHIENDYIFQLDPLKFHLLPVKVKDEINSFFSKKEVIKLFNEKIVI